ncbi:MAG: UPF0182 family protein, partial [Planctomycetota bacterium]
MFFLLGVLILAAGALPLLLTLKKAEQLTLMERRRRLRIGVGLLAGTILALILFNVVFHFYTEYLWFAHLGYGSRFWTVLWGQVILYAIGAVVAFGFLYANLRTAMRAVSPGLQEYVTLLVAAGLALLMGVWTAGMWEQALLFVHQAPSETVDPVFGKSVSFYLFSLPFFTEVVGWLIFLVVLTVWSAGFAAFVGINLGGSRPDAPAVVGKLVRQAVVLAALLLLVLGWNAYLALFRLLYSEWGVVTGAAYVDVHFRTIGYYVSIAVCVLSAAALIAAGFSSEMRRKLLGLQIGFGRVQTRISARGLILPGAAVGLVLIATWLLPRLVMTLVVRPNEVTLEKPFIRHNIRMTSIAYGINEERIERREYEVEPAVTQAVADRNRQTLRNVRLWDPRALMDNLQEQQEIRLYYKFAGVDIDRYHLGDEYRQVMLSVREMQKSELARQSQTWVSRHLKYTHGHGLVLLPVHEFLPQGKPKLLIRNIPPQEDLPSLDVNRPEIYYGELSRDHVYVRTEEKEFDYPRGDENVYTTYEGAGGVPMDDLFKRFAYAWKFDGHRILFSAYFTPDSRVMFHRAPPDRLRKLAPFLRYDRDPYPVITDDGRIKYIVDAYTTSSRYPYSEPYRGVLRHLRGINYIRNSVKCVVDAYDGTTDFYVFDDDDVILRTYRNIFPDLFKPRSEMPPDL